MFDVKQNKLFDTDKNKNSSNKEPKNLFIQGLDKKAAETRSWNGALKYSRLDDVLTTQFGSLSQYKKPRPFSEISKQMSDLLDEQGPLNTVKFSLFVRMITRKCQFPSGKTTEVVQRGGGLRHEGLMRMIWLHTQNEDLFWDNVELLIAAGSWKDIIQILSYDLQYNGWNNRKINWTKAGNLLLSGLENSNTRELIKKYLPQIKARKQCTTLEAQADNLIAKWICSLLYGTKNEGEHSSNYKKYRKLKSSGTAHEWQQLISKRQFDRIDFNKIHGRALALLVKGKFLDNSGLRNKYDKWITAPTTKDVKYTGYLYELFEALSPGDSTRRTTTDKQFLTKIEETKLSSDINHFIVVRDTSGSMGSTVKGTKTSCFDMAKVLALYFSYILEGYFKNHYIEFNSRAKLCKWSGQTPTEKWFNDRASYIGSTNFLSVIDLFIELLKSGVPEDQFPKGILCISDNEFNSSPQHQKTNLQTAKDNMLKAGFSKEYVSTFIVVLWNLQSNAATKFETYESGIGGLYYMGGFDGSILEFLTREKVKSARDLALEALDQELLNLVKA